MTDRLLTVFYNKSNARALRERLGKAGIKSIVRRGSYGAAHSRHTWGVYVQLIDLEAALALT